ncbi:MAG: hypothetical protein Q8Q63_08980 [Phaeovulum sp.]|uniref:hypothetical protein n=2 Tax=Phaeovulum sp. TaxID=2934796 RepID=UPI002730DC9C|nr:hypothetical protein [Phaeovulum sp.]MDP2061640.1 hypothetical protein [Phaeovulum sp.]MDP3861704.1 hypothetical protein [Phaeovulum sp.]
MMIRSPRSLFAICLALLLAATSMTMAVARGQTRVAGEIVICSGYGLTTISVDEFGNEVTEVQICPDMALGLMAALAHTPPVVERPAGRVSDLILVEPRLLHARSFVTVRARGPPVAV